MNQILHVQAIRCGYRLACETDTDLSDNGILPQFVLQNTALDSDSQDSDNDSFRPDDSDHDDDDENDEHDDDGDNECLS